MRRVFLAAAAVLAMSPLAVLAEAAYPSKPVTVIVPYPPGGTNDNVARLIAKKVSDKAGQPFVIDYKAGAGGTIGAAHVAQAKPDGYTLLNASIGNLAIAPQLIKVNYDPIKSFDSVAFIGNGITTFAVRPGFPAKNLQEFVAYAKANPGKVTIGTSGVGTPGHVAGEYFQQLAGIQLVHVPYKGSSPAVSDAVAGHVDLVIDPLSTTFVREGRLKALAYFGSDQPPEGGKGVASVASQGYPQWTAAMGGSFFWTAPTGLPPAVRDKLTRWVLDALADPDVQQALVHVQVKPEPLGAAATTDKVREMHKIAQGVLNASVSVANAR